MRHPCPNVIDFRFHDGTNAELFELAGYEHRRSADDYVRWLVDSEMGRCRFHAKRSRRGGGGDSTFLLHLDVYPSGAKFHTATTAAWVVGPELRRVADATRGRLCEERRASWLAHEAAGTAWNARPGEVAAVGRRDARVDGLYRAGQGKRVRRGSVAYRNFLNRTYYHATAGMTDAEARAAAAAELGLEWRPAGNPLREAILSALSDKR